VLIESWLYCGDFQLQVGHIQGNTEDQTLIYSAEEQVVLQALRVGPASPKFKTMYLWLDYWCTTCTI
jgi:hypothetical protein